MSWRGRPSDLARYSQKAPWRGYSLKYRVSPRKAREVERHFGPIELYRNGCGLSYVMGNWRKSRSFVIPLLRELATYIRNGMSLRANREVRCNRANQARAPS